jgi:hypothetical protein
MFQNKNIDSEDIRAPASSTNVAALKKLWSHSLTSTAKQIQ